jgi:hypothetical protein
LKNVKSNKSDLYIDESGRSYAVTRIIELCKEKGYKEETCYLGMNVMDRILSMTYKTLKRE